MTTTFPALKEIQRRWWLVDAKGVVLGRLASRIVLLLRGKHKPTYTPHLDVGDFVIVINAKEIKVTGQKQKQKLYQTYSGYPSGLKRRSLEEMLRRHPERVMRIAVKGMLPDGPLGRRLLGKLKVYAGPHHPHQAQQPEPVNGTLVGSHDGHSSGST
jgi:large subunit ribosomal protein L13